ncbi:lipopolysaccharide A protein [Vibrio tritonius]|uniref:Lipopolysaccharide A protein n=1 Tax=Vibrio tritonius TaxID=1435069 RepID=A0ABS7YSF1_9VIBR|nr:glycosyl transferase family 90 [Vibrio tritonius]MCA2018610.1 lipopolysaccharide A protein [Vibrio tritonius]
MRKIQYYLSSVMYSLVPNPIMRGYVNYRLNRLSHEQRQSMQQRLNYYHQVQHRFSTTPEAKQASHFKKNCGSTYYYDILKVIKGFDPNFSFDFIHGDVTEVPSSPTFVKSRPIAGHNHNSILLKLNEVRHYRFVKDKLSFSEKSDRVVWRGSGFRPNRRLLLETYFSHPRCNVGRTDTEDHDQLRYVLPKMSIKEQLNYKFILSLEGKDVATNLKWIMSSQSLVMTPKLVFETWFMEGKLIPGVHYVELKDDFSDLIEKMDYYLAHPDEAEQIISNANQWVAQFKQLGQERLLSYLVAERYFNLSQIPQTAPTLPWLWRWNKSKPSPNSAP